MAQVELIMPKMGESVAEATVIKWLKNVGDTIEIDESVLEIATDKVDSEIPSSIEGVLVKQLFKKDDVVLVGQAVAIIDTNADATEINETPVAMVEVEPSKEVVKIEKIIEETIETTSIPKSSDSNKFFSPLVLSIAQKEEISMSELESISGSGKNGRVTKKDILSYLSKRNTTPIVTHKTSTVSAAKINAPTPTIPIMEGDEIFEMDRMRKLISDHMVMSKHVSPHVTSFVEADVTNIVNWRNKVKDEFFKREREKITFTPIFLDAVVKAIKDFPMIF